MKEDKKKMEELKAQERGFDSRQQEYSLFAESQEVIRRNLECLISLRKLQLRAEIDAMVVEKMCELIPKLTFIPTKIS